MRLLQAALLVSVGALVSPTTASHGRRDHGELSALLQKRNVTYNKDRSDDASELNKRAGGQKYVFMHHIVGNTYPYTQGDWQSDIQQLQAKGVDALALNVGFDYWQRDQVASAYNAAQALGTGFKLFISYDFTALPCDVGSVVDWVNRYAGHPNQFRVDGRPLISSFLGECLGNGGWAAVKSQTGGYLMPFLAGLEGNFGAWPSLDSWMCWGCAWPNGNTDKTTADDWFYINQLGGRYATTVSNWMFAHHNYKNMYQRGDEHLINNRWEQVVGMRDQLTFLEIVTWNDFGESDYFGPIKGAMPAGTTWAEGFPHTAWFDMSQYYITAFKTGSYPAITQDVIYYWSRPHPTFATAYADGLPPPSGFDWAEDFLWAAVFSTAQASVTLKMGGSQQTFAVGPGVTKLKIPTAPGQITVAMVRNGQTIIDQTPNDFTFITNPALYNYNAYVGAANSNAGGGNAWGAPPNSAPSGSATTSAPADAATPVASNVPVNRQHRCPATP